ncbi:DegT/DnrJ/EryC1/StrS family aminotransferase [Microbacterium caowuchunii]|uniref:DegT/DnrJ/EryC1/StrS family aminotransferase n=1 Tax=Microbacterium caowuchunii TaxID=2614638 RepID=A0A5N0TNQ2_9MICO|nr:DegT/DnrJ/EryC1/StrS family aminotransferase [Microbacterium caowuchunii]KAA9135536.1 DegT/DnrJ/EryC1/StrS family aminotransferase [Microbacterium caowuchunii]
MTTSTTGGTAVTVPFLDLAAQQAEVFDAVSARWQSLLRTAAFIGGAEVDAFEREYAAYIGVDHVVGVANGTDALELAYRGVGVRPGDEVIMPANTFVATAEAASRIGAIPVFVDVDEEHLLISPTAVARAITPRTRAIVPVHLFGQTAPLAALLEIGQDRGIPIVEDAAQAQGARSAAGRAGSLGTVAATSFYPGKNLGGAGDGGAVLTDDPEIAAQVRVIASHGSSVKYVHERVGINSRLDAIQAVVLREKLPRLDAWNRARQRAADRYADLLGDIPGVRIPRAVPGNEDVWHLYVVRVPARSAVVAELDAAGIGVGIHYPTPVHLTAAYRHLGYTPGSFAVAEGAARHILSLPIYPHLSGAQQEYVADVLRTAVARG